MNGPHSMLEVAIWAQTVVWLAVAVGFILTRQASLYHPVSVYLLFHGLVFVARPWALYYLNCDNTWNYIRFEPTEEQLIRALAASSLALIVLSSTAVAFGWTQTRFRLKEPDPPTRAQVKALLATTLLLAPVILYSIRTQFSGAFVVENRGGTYVMAGASGYSLEAQYMAGPLICAWLAAKGFRWPTLLPIVPFILYRTYAGMSRWTFVLLFLAMTLIYAWRKRSKWPPLWALLCAIPVLLLFKSIGDNRQFVVNLLTGVEAAPTTVASQPLRDKLRAALDTPDFANFDFLTYVIAIVPARTEKFTYWAQYLQLLTEPVPRKLWPGKPVGAPVRLFNLNDYGNFLGMTASLVGDAWMSCGWVGIIVTMTAFGAVLGAAHRWFWRHSDSMIASLVYLIALAMLPQWYRDGGISIAKFLFWNLLPILLWVAAIWLAGPRRIPCHSRVLPAGTRLRLIEPCLPTSK